MKKILFIAFVFLALANHSKAQTRVELDYQYAKDTLSNELLAFMDMSYIKVVVHGDIKGKKWILYSNQCDGDSVITKPVFPYTFEFSDSTAIFTFLAQPEGNDNVNISCNTPNYGGAKVKYAINRDSDTEFPRPYILMETFSTKPLQTTDEINLIAYTSGILSGKTSYSFCDLRDKKSDPRTWQKEHKVPRFVYFSLRLG